MDGSMFGASLMRLDQRVGTRDCADVDITARLATTPEVFTEAWSVRHAAYLSQGFIERSEDGLFKDEYDDLPSAKTVVVYKNQVPVATVRVCLYAPDSGIKGSERIPAMDIFESEIYSIKHQFLDSKKPMRSAEVVRLSRHPDLGSDFEPVFALFRMVGYLLLHFEVDAVMSAVRKHHMAFYRRMGFRRMTDPRPYSKIKLEAALMACVRNQEETLSDCLPVLRLISTEDSNYQDFLRGREVPVFAASAASSEIGGLFGRRFEGARPSSPPPFAADTRSRLWKTSAARA